MFVFHDPKIKMPATQQIAAREWVLEYPFWHVDKKTGKSILIPPSGIGRMEDWIDNPIWTTDYRSGGSVADLLVDKQGDYSADWIVHDFSYAAELFSRSECDWRLLNDLKESGANWLVRNVVWGFVKTCGWNIWRKHDQREVGRLRLYQRQCETLFQMPPVGH